MSDNLRDRICDVLSDLIVRMDTAEVRLVEMAEEHKAGSDRRKQLEGKANGMRLARGYVRDELNQQELR